ncbi:MAG TPA: AraC family transcriptional regulator [Campylobacterales bacterium]|nr:AraC family transcriptional regulator [Campylobacterales bacterium]
MEVKYTKEVYNSYKKHHHDTLAIATVKQGKIQIEFDHKIELLTPFSLVVFNPYENHKTTIIDSDTSDYYVLYFELSWCLNIQNSEIFNPINQSIVKDKFLHKLFFSLHNSQDEKEAKLFVTKLFEESCGEITDNKTTPEILQMIIDFIKDSDYEILSLEVLARYADISQNHLIRIFKKEFGLSPHAYILNLKIHKAKRLLEQKMPIAEVALEVGFYDQSHFHKAFKSVFAITPKEFQKKLIFYKT